jgi:hypothetical protein
MMEVVRKLKAVLGFGQGAQIAQQGLLQQLAGIRELTGRLQSQVLALRSTAGTLTVFWSRSYVGLHGTLEAGCQQHLSEIEKLRADVELAMQEVGGLQGRKLGAAQAHARALRAQADELRHEIAERERFWKAEADWALSLLGERKPTSWPPEPRPAMAEAA